MTDPAFNLFTDGACRGNPGQGGAGAVLVDEKGNIFATVKNSLGLCTNNIAEYRALILGLEEALKTSTASSPNFFAQRSTPSLSSLAV